MLSTIAGVTVAATALIAPAPTPGLTAGELNTIFQRPSLAQQWAGGDVALSTGNKKGTWWFFGDTMQAPKQAKSTWLTSSILYIPSSTLQPQEVAYTDSVNAPLGAPLPSLNGVKYWPSSLVRDPRSTSRIILGASKAVSLGPGQWDFRIAGGDLFDVALRDDLKVPTMRVKEKVKTPQPKRGAPIHWGSALAIADGTLYIYGSREVPGQFGKDIYLATAPAQRWKDTATWRYHSAGTRSQASSVNMASVLVPASQGMPHTFSVIKHPSGSGWLLVAKKDEGLGRYVVAAAAADPQGPWDTFVNLIDARPRNGVWQYLALAHPTVSSGGSALIISTSRNVVVDGGFRRIIKDPTLYRPVFHRVELDRLPRAI